VPVALITGITGMVGSHLADYILEHSDWEVVGMARWRSPLSNIAHLVPRINGGNRISLVHGDLRDSASIDSVVRGVVPDFVFHLAAQSFPQTSFTAPLDTLETNVQGTARVLESLREYAPDAVTHVCSSSEVFGRVSADKLPIDEDCNFHPASPYAISKVGTDLIGRYYAEAFDMNVMTTRMFTHTGPRRGDVFAESSFAKQIALAESGLRPPVIRVGNLQSLRTIADVRDAVRAYFLLVTVNPVPGEYYNIGGNHSLSIGELLNDLISLSSLSDSLEIEIDESRLRPIDADLQVPDTRKFREHTGWEPVIPYQETILDLLNYWRSRVADEGDTFLVR
jgi:GDP-mannose 4,6-dehydratase